jgi:hypothetical protein
MKTLNRPMFRYGGPIKEGIMSGIKEPRQRYQEAGTVQPPVQNVYKFSETPVAKGLTGFVNYGPNAAIAGAYDLAAVPINTLARAFGYNPGFSGTKFVDTLTGGQFSKQTGYDPEVARFLGFKTSAKKGFTTPSMNVEQKITELENKDSGVEEIEDTTTVKTSGGVELTDKERRAKKLEEYRDIVDIKGMNKQAAYDSLIAASAAVNQAGGDLKGAIKDGSLINSIIQSTSKAFDKPQKTKDAIDTLILKGQIEKDIKGPDAFDKKVALLGLDDPKAAAKYRKKELGILDFTEAKIAASKDLSGQAAIDAGANLASDNFKGNIVTNSDWTKIEEGLIEKFPNDNTIDRIKKWTEEKIKGRKLPDGDYTVGDSLVSITKNKVTEVQL